MKIVYYLKERKNGIVIFLCTFLLGLTINEVAVSDYALQFRHHSYKDPDIVYVYAQQGNINWSNAVSSAVQNWNNARLPYSTKPIFAKGTISWELYISSKSYPNQDWNGYWDSPNGYDSNTGHVYPPTKIILNDYWVEQKIVSSSEMIGISAHEMGHELGLDDVSDSSVLMYKFTPKVTSPQGDDLNGVAVKSNVCKTTH